MNKKITIKFKLTRQNVLFDPNKTWHWLSTVKFSFEVVDVTVVFVVDVKKVVCVVDVEEVVRVIDVEELTPFPYKK